jgi:hypothetical protein
MHADQKEDGGRSGRELRARTTTETESPAAKRPSTRRPPTCTETSQEPERRRGLKSGLRSTARSSRSRSRSQASARQLREAKRGGSAGAGVSSRVRRPGMATSSAGARGGGRFAGTGSGVVTRRADDSTSSYADSDVRLASVATTGCCTTFSSAEPACTRTAIVRAMNSSTSLCRQVCPQRCFIPGRSRLREFHPLTRNSPPCSEATNQWFVCFFSVAQMSHDMACRITAFPPVRTVFPRISLVPHVLSRPGRRMKRCAAGRGAMPTEISWESPSFISSRIPGDGRVGVGENPTMSRKRTGKGSGVLNWNRPLQQMGRRGELGSRMRGSSRQSQA